MDRRTPIAGGRDFRTEAPGVAPACAFTTQVTGVATTGLQFLGAVRGRERVNAIGCGAAARAGIGTGHGACSCTRWMAVLIEIPLPALLGARCSSAVALRLLRMLLNLRLARPPWQFWVQMAKFTFDPPIRPQRGIVVLTLEDAVAFMRSYTDAKLPMARDAVMRRLEGARVEHELQNAANAFRTWAYAEDLPVA